MTARDFFRAALLSALVLGTWTSSGCSASRAAEPPAASGEESLRAERRLHCRDADDRDCDRDGSVGTACGDRTCDGDELCCTVPDRYGACTQRCVSGRHCPEESCRPPDAGCIDVVLCIRGTHWDSGLCKCVPDAAACRSDTDCSGILPHLCQVCPDGRTACAHWECRAGSCQISVCD